MTLSSTALAKTTEADARISRTVVEESLREVPTFCSGQSFMVIVSKSAASITRDFFGLALTILTVGIGCLFSKRSALIIGVLISQTL